MWLIHPQSVQEERRAKIQELKSAISAEAAALDADKRAEASAAALSAARLDELRARLARAHASAAEHARALTDLRQAEQRDKEWVAI